MQEPIRITPRFSGQLLSDALREAGIPFRLPCGGRQKCGNCKVLVAPPESSCINCAVLACAYKLEQPVQVLLPQQEEQPAIPASAFASALQYDGSAPGSLGAAVDIGTTTITMRLYEFPNQIPLATQHRMNAQGSFGADVVSRIASCAVPGGLDAIHGAITNQLQAMLRSACRDANRNMAEITRFVITGNTTMLHLFAKLDPTPMGVVPFTPNSLFGTAYKAADFFPDCTQRAELYLPPCVCAYVGADIVCGMAAARMGLLPAHCAVPHNNEASFSPAPRLLADVGTNGEMVLVDAQGKLTCCSTAAGPAFEGAEIEMGMPALPGAINKVWAENGTVQYDLIGKTSPVLQADGASLDPAEQSPKAIGICGTGMLGALRAFLALGWLDETGYIDDEADNPCYFETEDGQSAIRLGNSGVSITQADVRKLQLVKASVSAGIETLLNHAKLNPAEIDEVVLAGGFGASLNPADAAAVGMLPPALLPKAKGAGNTALHGAELLLFNAALRETAQNLANRTTEVQLAAEPFFQEAYIENMAFPIDG